MAQIGIIKIKKLVDALLDYIQADYSVKTGLTVTLVHTTANGVGVKQVDTITLSGTGSGVVIDADTTEHSITFDTDLTTTISSFITGNSTYYLSKSIILSTSGNNIIFTAQTAGIGFDSPTVQNAIDDSFLMRCFDDDDYIEEVSYKKLAIEIFLRQPTDHRKIETRLLFDVDRAALPTIHVREPSKNKGKQDGIGNFDQGFFGNLDDSTQDIRRRSFDSNYELMITSMNRHEVIIIEEVLLALFIGAQDSFVLADPFYTIQFSVKELIANNELVPNPLFIKAIGLNVSYDKKYPDLSEDQILHKILFDQKVLN